MESLLLDALIWIATAYCFYNLGYSKGFSDGVDDMQTTHLD